VDHFFLIERHLAPMLDIVAGLGDELANTVPDLAGANTPYQLVFHCCGMLEWWTHEVALGQPVRRDRDGEFTAHGTVEQLRERVEQVVHQLERDLPDIDPDARPAGQASAHYVGTPIGDTNGGVLQHVLEELAQHHGQLELTRDVLVKAYGMSSTRPNA
jgi:hypothetical protein